MRFGVGQPGRAYPGCVGAAWSRGFAAISVEEIWRGLRQGEEAVARRLFNGLRLAPLGVAQAIQAGNWRREFAEDGVTLHQADCLIAAAAEGIGATIATDNVDDFPMREVMVERWPVGV